MKIIGNVLKYELGLLIIPIIISLYYKEAEVKSFIFTILLMSPIAIALCKVRTTKNEMYAREGFLTVGLTWITISFVGALPFVFSGSIPSIVDAIFETVSGFTTTSKRNFVLEKFYTLDRWNGIFNIYTCAYTFTWK